MKTTLALIYLSLSMTLAFMAGQHTEISNSRILASFNGCGGYLADTGVFTWHKAEMTQEQIEEKIKGMKLMKPPTIGGQ